MGLLAIIHVPDHTTPDDIVSQRHTLEQIYGSQLVGIFNYPTRRELKCSGSCVRKGSGAWSRDRRGFMKCSICGSRNRKLRQWVIGALFDFLGANLYKQAPGAFCTPDGYGESRHDD